MNKIIFVIITLAAILAILLVNRIRYNFTVEQIWRTLSTPPSQARFTPAMVADLPEAVQKYFLHAIAPETPLANSVQLSINGSLKPNPDGEWLPMSAEQIISTSPGFVWKATVKQGWINFTGADYYYQSRGKMRFSFWGLLPLVNAQNEDITRSASGRLGGEYMWLPSALLPQNGVSWQQIDSHTIEAHFKINQEPITLTLTIDQDGRLLKLSLPRWGDKTDSGSWEYIPFTATIEQEKTTEGYTIPSEISAGWWFDTEQEYKFYRATIEQAQFYHQ